MSQEKEAEKMGRRTFLKYAAGAAAGVVIGAVAVYGATELTRPGPTTVTAPGTTVVTTAPGTTVVTTAPPTPGTVSERAIAGAKALVDSGAVPKGTVLKLLHVAGSRAQLAPFINDWKNKTGIGVELVTVGVEGDVFTKLMAEATAKTGIYDLGTVFSTWIGDLVESGIAKDLDGYYKKYDPIGPPDVAPIEPLGGYTTIYNNKRYAVFADADVYTLTYRTDLFENETYKAGFKSKFGYDLKAPDTWEQVLDMSKYFYDLNLKAPDGTKMYGSFFYCEPGFAGYTTWWCIFTAKGGILFSPKDMKAMVNSPEGIEALELQAKLVPYMHPEAVTGSWPSLYQRYSEGKAPMAMAWPSLLKWAQDPATSQVVGKNATAVVPGAEVTVGGQKKLVKAAVNPVNWVGIVSNYSKYPEAAYLFLQWWTSPEIGFQVIPILGIMDAFRTNWFAADSKERAIMEVAYTPQFLDVFKESISVSFPDLTLPNAYTYLDVLNKNINAVCAGTKNAKDALDETAEAWEGITDKFGRDKLTVSWQSISKLYPKDVQEVWKAKGYVS